MYAPRGAYCMAQVNLGDYRNLYLQTASEYIGKISESLNQLSSDLGNKEALNNLHIASHSLKSQSQVMGMMEIAEICLNIEKTSDEALKEIVQLNSESVLNIKESMERLSGMLDALSQ